MWMIATRNATLAVAKNEIHTVAYLMKNYYCILILFLAVSLPKSEAFAVNVRNVDIDTGSIGKVVFSHKDHINKGASRNNCRACHDKVFDLRNKKHFSMADMEKGKSCGSCHKGSQAFAVASCVKCHPVREITYQVKETGPTHFSHKKHLEFEPCSACHPKPYSANRKNNHVTMTAMGKGKSCGFCHNAKRAFSVKECSKCHPVKELQFEEKSTGNVLFSHKQHTTLYTCIDCHTKLFSTLRSKVKISMGEMEQGKSCGSCHDGTSAFSVKEKCESCHKM